MVTKLVDNYQNEILIVTSSIDYTIDYIIHKFRNVRFYRLNVDMIASYSITIKNTGWEISSTFGTLTLANTSSIYYRKPMLPDLSLFHPKYRTMIGVDIISVIKGLVDSFDGPVITKPSLLYQVENKTFQLQELSKIKVRFPQSVIGNSLNMDGLIASPQKIVKPLTTGKLDLGDELEIFQTNILTTAVGDISITPIYIQEYVEKKYEVRITCFRDFCWAVRIDSTDKTDWRKLSAQNKYFLMDIPVDISQECAAIMRKLGIIFGAFDYIVNQNGDWIFLEVNPNGQWLWLELELGLDISDKIIDYLKEGAM